MALRPRLSTGVPFRSGPYFDCSPTPSTFNAISLTEDTPSRRRDDHQQETATASGTSWECQPVVSYEGRGQAELYPATMQRAETDAKHVLG